VPIELRMHKVNIKYQTT